MTALDCAAEHIAIVEAGYTVGCAAAAAAWQATFDRLDWERLTPEECSRISSRVANLVLEAAQSAYIKAVTND